VSELDLVWQGKTDDELVQAADRLFEYTEAGERCIRDEMRRRGLPEPEPPVGRCARCGRAISWNHPGTECSECDTPFPAELLQRLAASVERDELVDECAVFVANGEVEARQIESLLQGAGIPCATRGEAFGRIYGLTVDGLGAVRIVVSGPDEERARALLEAAQAGELRLPEESTEQP
jgi:hypothetical protein